MQVDRRQIAARNNLKRHISEAWTIVIGISSLVIILVACHNPTKTANCSEVRKGIFYGRMHYKGKLFRFQIERTDSMQIEKNETDSTIAKYRIKWLDSCTYRLDFRSTTQHLTKEALYFKETLVFTTKINGVTPEFYLFTTKTNLTDDVLTDTLWRNPK